MKLNKYENLNKAKLALFERGFMHQFVIKGKNLVNKKNRKIYSPKDLVIVEFHRFNTRNKANKTELVFAIECKDKTKGIIISIYKDCADMQLIKFMEKVKIKSRSVSATAS